MQSEFVWESEFSMKRRSMFVPEVEEEKAEMTEKIAAIVGEVHPNLLEPPHVLGTLIEFMVGERQPDFFQQEQQELVAHVVVCEYCRTAIIVMLTAAKEYEQSSEHPDTSVYDLLDRFVGMHHKIQSWEHEQMGAYAEALVAQGEEEANRRFPALAKHISACPDCQAALEDTVAFLHESDGGD